MDQKEDRIKQIVKILQELNEEKIKQIYQFVLHISK